MFILFQQNFVLRGISIDFPFWSRWELRWGQPPHSEKKKGILSFKYIALQLFAYLSSSDDGKHALLIFEFLLPRKIWHIMGKENRKEKWWIGRSRAISEKGDTERRATFRLLSLFYTFPLIVIEFYLWCLCVCVHMYVFFGFNFKHLEYHKLL